MNQIYGLDNAFICRLQKQMWKLENIIVFLV